MFSSVLKAFMSGTPAWPWGSHHHSKGRMRWEWADSVYWSVSGPGERLSDRAAQGTRADRQGAAQDRPEQRTTRAWLVPVSEQRPLEERG